ncbi:DUF2207 domain-containing protein [Flavobacterium sp. ACN6]|uniref:DUF2207 domain-containing protein n=1 Tax=Flavobacterium sp. ACN6 TaxID=1920426 RepID=UPI000BB3A367|nr:DUF2207 domain-containing protein [Flavobacterium sp. ACN6]PBJ12845.1 hypothetical protein BSF42_20260 [Flavobacterium sp. ACN6]
MIKKLHFLFFTSILLFSFSQGYCQNDSIPVNEKKRVEKINQFHSDILIKENGNLIVTEIIKVYAAGLKINHGIYRQLPMRSTSPKTSKNNYYTILDITKNGFKEPYHVALSGDGESMSIYIGSKKVYLPNGIYTYKITYEVEAQIHSYDEFDEVYWNVTGNYWEFDIENVTAKVTLPKSAKAIQTYCYTGIFGSKANDCNAKIVDNFVYFTSKNLKHKEGFTIAAGFPKGIVNQPFFRPHYKMEEFLSAEKMFNALLALLICFGFYYFSWKKYGEDPLFEKNRKIIDLKDLYSAPALRYIKDSTADEKNVLTSIIDLSIKGAIEISDNGKESWQDGFEYSIKKGKEIQNLSKENEVVLNTLFLENDSFPLDSKAYLIINKASLALSNSLQKTYNLKDYYLGNWNQVLLGFLITIPAILVYSHFAKGIILWSGIFSCLFFIFLVLLLRGFVKSLRKRDFFTTAGCLFLFLFIGAFFFGLVFIPSKDQIYSVLDLSVIFLIISGFFLYLSLIGKYTKLGAETKFQIERWKQELLDYKPEENDQTISIYEEILPYAFAIGIEEEWNLKFIDILKRLNYKNNWIKTTSTSSGFTLRTVTNFRTTYNTFSSSSSSGSSGGGSSGGGGGGGGGGGW